MPRPEAALSAWREAAARAGGAAALEPWDYEPAPPFVLDDDGYLITDSMPRNERHSRRLRVCWTVLDDHFQGRGSAVSANLSMPYVRGQPHKVVVPDLLVARATEASGGRNSYKLWEEPTPDFVLDELAPPGFGPGDLPPGSLRPDQVDKRALYQRLGVPEYWMFDETGARLRDDSGAPLGEMLVGYRLRGGEYERVRANAAGRLPSEALGLELCYRDGLLRFFDAAAGEFLRTYGEQRVQREAAERRAASVAELETALRAQGDAD